MPGEAYAWKGYTHTSTGPGENFDVGANPRRVSLVIANNGSSSIQISPVDIFVAGFGIQVAANETYEIFYSRHGDMVQAPWRARLGAPGINCTMIEVFTVG